jgi:glycosyltransferase involved in cell wall biosynthesis
MNILWFTWKDRTNPAAGGAEAQSGEHCRRLAAEGHNVTIITSSYPGARSYDRIDGYHVIRRGNKYTVFIWAVWNYFFHIKNKRDIDIIIEEINTVPFMTQWYATSKKRFLYIYQLSRQIWFHEIFFPINILGYLLEPLYLFFLNNNRVCTESESTKRDLMRFGFSKKLIHIVPIGIDQEKNLQTNRHTDSFTKYRIPTILSFGMVRSMKQTLAQVKAFEIVKKSIPNVRLIICGNATTDYGKRVLTHIQSSPVARDITHLGWVSESKKQEIMRKSHMILVTSVKEGWGMIVTEAARYQTPAVVYNVDGLRDSVVPNKTGIICKTNTPDALAHEIVALLQDEKKLVLLGKNAATHARKFTYNKAYRTFLSIINT